MAARVAAVRLLSARERASGRGAAQLGPVPTFDWKLQEGPPERLLSALDGFAWLLLLDGCVLPSRRLAPDLAAAAERAGNGQAVVPRCPNVHGPQRLVLGERDKVATEKERIAFAGRQARNYAGELEGTSFISDLAALVPAGLVTRAAGASYTDTASLFGSLLKDTEAKIAYQAVAFSVQVKERLVPVAPTSDPLVSCCVIAKNEEREIERCIRSAAVLADEVIVYDTGSTDATVSIARGLGAKVIEGEWRNDFAWARNQTLAHARGRWIFWLDADETLAGDVAELRTRLADPLLPYEAYSIRIVSPTGSGLSVSEHFANRVFKRATSHWRGALHETVWLRDGSRTSYSIRAGEIHLDHSGYLDQTMGEKRKGERNLEVASHNHSAGHQAEVALHKARSQLLLGEYEAARGLCRRAVVGSEIPSLEKFAYLVIIDSSRALGEYQEAYRAIEALDTTGAHPFIGLEQRSRCLLEEGRFAEALEAVGKIDRWVADADGLTVDPIRLSGIRAQALAGMGRPGDAVAAILEGLRSGLLDIHLGVLVGWMDEAGVELSELARAIPRDKQKVVVAQLLQINAEMADRVITGLLAETPGERTLLAAASLVARILPLERAAWWSRILVDAGLGPSSPLLAIARDEESDFERRLEAARIGGEEQQIGACASIYMELAARAKGRGRKPTLSSRS